MRFHRNRNVYIILIMFIIFYKNFVLLLTKIYVSISSVDLIKCKVSFTPLQLWLHILNACSQLILKLLFVHQTRFTTL